MELCCQWSPRELNIDRDPHEPPDANLADRRGALRAETASLSDARRVSYRYARRSSLVNTRTRGGSGGRAVGGSLRRLRKPGRGRCVVREGAFGGRTLARARSRARKNVRARRAGAPAPFDAIPPAASTFGRGPRAQTDRFACAHAEEDGRARSEPESARPPSPARCSTRWSERALDERPALGREGSA